MKATILPLLCLFTLFKVHSKTLERISYYFEEDAIELTPESNLKLSIFQQTIEKSELKIVKCNAFMHDSISADKGKDISEARLHLILKKLNLDLEKGISFNHYGLERIKLNFVPHSWNRIDIYYTVRNTKKTSKTKIKSHKESLTSISQSSSPYILPIAFSGNSFNIEESTTKHLDEIIELLNSDLSLQLHIRGHVCCGSNTYISSMRAKSVYSYLLEAGISKKRLSYKGYSNKYPLVTPERNNKDRSKNRRVDIIFSKKCVK